jgi:predicted DNA-binding antitoxin AbrB/MazE fold protein
MTTEIEAVYQAGVLKPLQPLQLRENQRVRLSIEPLDKDALLAWLSRVQEVRQRIFERHGYLPDSTEIIRQDRERDV